MMTLLEACQLAIRVAEIHEASFVPATPVRLGRYAKDWGACTTEVIAPDHPAEPLVYFLAISGEGNDYACCYVERCNSDTNNPTTLSGDVP